MNYYGAADLAESFRTVRKNTIIIADEIGEEHYGFRPTPENRSVAETLLHVTLVPKVAHETTVVRKLSDMVNFDFMGFVGGSVFGVAAAGFTFSTYMRATLDALAMRDIITGLIKSVMFGLVITTVGCQEGLRTGLGAEEVGRSTTAAVVKSIFLVIMVDLVFTAMFYFGVG